MLKSSRIPGFYKLSIDQRIDRLAETYGLSREQIDHLRSQGSLTLEHADKMIENAVGIYSLPIGVATNFTVNGEDVLIPMAIEEASVVAAASAGALAARAGGGFTTSSSGRRMIGQVQVVGCPDFDAAKRALVERKSEIMRAADGYQRRMVERGGGMRDVEVRDLDPTGSKYQRMLVVHLITDTVDAMGANTINTIAEGVAPLIEEITGGRVILRILSNFSDQCLSRSECTIPKSALASDPAQAEAVIDGIIHAQAFAEMDPYRAVTHNKGVMNGIDAVVIATGNDWRAIEAAAHAYAARTGKYRPMTEWWRDENGDLRGRIELPMAVGTVGGSVQLHPMAQISRKFLRVDSAEALGGVIVSCGLAQNFSALRALATDGIQKGHMALHARNVAITAGARGEEVDRIAGEMRRLKDIKVERATELLKQARGA